MTIVCAKKDGDTVWIASDSRMTSHHFIDPGVHEKWIEVGGWWFGLTGSIMMHRIIRQACRVAVESDGIYGIAEAVMGRIRQLDWTPHDEDRGSPKWFAAAFIAVSPTLDVFEVFGTGAVNPVGENFIAVGSGSDCAYGAWHATEVGIDCGADLDIAATMVVCVQAAITYTASCGPPVFAKGLGHLP